MEAVKDTSIEETKLPEETEKQISKLPEWKQAITRKLMLGRQKLRSEKYEKLRTEVNEKLHELIDLYFKSYCLDDDENKHNHDVLNAEWKSLCQKMKVTAKNVITLDVKAFENAVEINLARPEFQEAIAKMKLEEETPDVQVESENAQTQEQIVNEQP